MSIEIILLSSYRKENNLGFELLWHCGPLAVLISCEGSTVTFLSLHYKLAMKYADLGRLNLLRLVIFHLSIFMFSIFAIDK